MKFIRYFLLIFLTIIFSGCQTLKDGLQGNKRSNNAEEFLIEKKNPLVLPPDFTELPKPINKNEDKNIKESFDLKKVLSEGKTGKNEGNVDTNKSFKSKILEKINEN